MHKAYGLPLLNISAAIVANVQRQQWGTRHAPTRGRKDARGCATNRGQGAPIIFLPTRKRGLLRFG
eukprot:1146519-Pelagomonas_calceolata.AAC.4